MAARGYLTISIRTIYECRRFAVLRLDCYGQPAQYFMRSGNVVFRVKKPEIRVGVN